MTNAGAAIANQVWKKPEHGEVCFEGLAVTTNYRDARYVSKLLYAIISYGAKCIVLDLRNCAKKPPRPKSWR
jgi:hypothetical protein